MTRYSSTNDGLFHTLHLSTDHSVRVGLSFDSKDAAQDFHSKVLQLTNDPANVALKGPRRNIGPTKSHYYLDNLPNKNVDQKKNVKIPNKMDISQPCGFQHVVSVSQSDFKKKAAALFRPLLIKLSAVMGWNIAAYLLLWSEC